MALDLNNPKLTHTFTLENSHTKQTKKQINDIRPGPYMSCFQSEGLCVQMTSGKSGFITSANSQLISSELTDKAYCCCFNVRCKTLHYRCQNSHCVSTCVQC